MSKFKVRLKITGMELEVEGTRDDVPLIAQSVGQQFSHLLQPASQIVEGEIVSNGNHNQTNAIDAQAPVRKRSTRRRTSSAAATNGSAARGDKETLNWVHDPSKWGNPQQSWTASQKSIWLLYVAEHETSTNSMSSQLIVRTFNKHFQQAKTIQVSQVNRDLGRLKTGKDSPVGEDTTQTPSRWFLTQRGQEDAKALVQEALGQSGK
jgi:hypothetical protein